MPQLGNANQGTRFPELAFADLEFGVSTSSWRGRVAGAERLSVACARDLNSLWAIDDEISRSRKDLHRFLEKILPRRG